MQEKTRLELDIENVGKSIEKYKKTIENLQQKLHQLNEVKQKYNPDAILGKDLYLSYKDIDKCNKVGFNGNSIFLYFLSDGVKILGKDFFTLYDLKYRYSNNDYHNNDYSYVFNIKNYDEYIPQNFPNRKYIIKKN